MNCQLILTCVYVSFTSCKHWCGHKNVWDESLDASNTNDAILTYGPHIPRVDVENDYNWNPLMSLIDEDSSYTTPKADLDENGFGLNVTSGIFKAPEDGYYVATLTAMMPFARSSNSYAQLYLLRDGSLVHPEDYLLVEPNKIANMVTSRKPFTAGETLAVFLGHYKPKVVTVEPSGGFSRDRVVLTEIRFCVFDS